ncbi:bifunctional 2-polyprenyl-6-hydroxyphenol methylase/3-demethylubiquinol 3-O-methyltransferase UbiG [Sphingomonas sp.]|uniref:bifunctional 2-polyprenyl-6-hydroxyphenol methylase/3-demethylubiquinol 3-O-methyltransferase UbiG n=1 Tax=Sphingomonas sp. TaxID=28214 RepID=UPI0025D435C0|nr:bifunctional 2-polyprenyl-6-hydroxyphenol methylase/3-demethylubiquinol 3-O-methyltransferase UbiG [Sphingomonas sp.]
MASDPSILSREAVHFGAMAGDWWNPNGSSAMLHKLNPVRLGYIRAAVDRHWQFDPTARRPLAGKRALDMGCGAGLLTEPLARLGAEVTGVDAAPENIAAASAHAVQSRLAVEYRAGGTDVITGSLFDLITCMEVIEHVADPRAFVAGLANALAPGGLLILSTPNRTALSKLAIITVAEGLGQIPRGTHDWDKFLTPDELQRLLAGAGLSAIDTRGISYRPGSGFALTDDLNLDYLMTAVGR